MPKSRTIARAIAVTRWLACGVLMCQASPVTAQDIAAETAPFHLGPVGLQPRVSLTDVGIDTNVYNNAANPRRDFTATLVPGVTATLPIKRALLTSKGGVELLYFKDATDQRSASFSLDGRLDVPLGVIAPFFYAGQSNTNQRPNTEIDARVGQREDTFAAGLTVRLGSRTSMDLNAERRNLDYDEVTIAGVALAQALNRQTGTGEVNVRVTLTPLTTLLLRSNVIQERFDESPFRDTDSVGGMAGFELRPFALISGKALVGYRSMTSVSGELPAFAGVIADVAVKYIWRDMTQIGVDVLRNVEPSFDEARPYYVLTSGMLTVTQALALQWDVVGRIGRDAFDYHERVGGADPVLARGDRDYVETVGSGLGYRLNPDLRVGFDVNYHRRRSTTLTRPYEGLRFGGSVVYGK
jgi:hypothetical protein